MDNTRKPVEGRIHFGSLEVIEAKKREAAARLAAATAASPAGTPPGTGTSTPSRGTTLDDLSKDDHFLPWNTGIAYCANTDHVLTQPLLCHPF